MIRNRKILIPLFILFIAVLGCGLFSSKTQDTEIVFAATEVGTPVGDKVAKDIGPEGGTLSSPDGRVTLTVPKNALTETLPFSIQPITNKADGGQGLAYRFGPDGRTFTVPLEITLKYDEDDLKGTVAEALLLAYQNQQGKWQQLKPKTFDPKNNTLSVSTTHFTDAALLSRMRINPASAAVHVGKSKGIEFIECREPGIIDRLRGINWRSLCSQYTQTNWTLTGPGTLEPAFGSASKEGKVPGYLYTAPAKYPVNNNVAFVDVRVQFEVQEPHNGPAFDR